MQQIIIFFLVFFIIIGIQSYGLLKFLITGDYNDRYRIGRKLRMLQTMTDVVLNEKYRYYKSLSPKGRNKFLARLSYVQNKVQFTGYEGLEVTDEMKNCVLFAKIQLTFGLKLFHFERFKKIILYPESFYSRFFNRNLLGLTSGLGFITLSWADFQEGYLVSNDRYNLGLHEMAHALRLELMDYGSVDETLQRLSDEMDKLAEDEQLLASRGVPSILRDYAFVNKEEFFSVCVEYFFEVPEILNQNKPELFAMLCRMLNQNPLNTTSDYRVT
ncbi:MAG: zinc-dependent peptidase [Bacteroidales bacterium]|nr:zinc-dependent peptidase [Bacteroidales bacterium]